MIHFNMPVVGICKDIGHSISGLGNDTVEMKSRRGCCRGAFSRGLMSSHCVVLGLKV